MFEITLQLHTQRILEVIPQNKYMCFSNDDMSIGIRVDLHIKPVTLRVLEGNSHCQPESNVKDCGGLSIILYNTENQWGVSRSRWYCNTWLTRDGAGASS